MPVTPELERELGEQPLGQIMKDLELKPHDMVAASTEQLTHKMVSRGVKGRRLTRNVQMKILDALNKASKKDFTLKQLFTY